MSDQMTDRPWVARMLVEDWQRATPDDKANRRRWGPMTRAACEEAHRSLGVTVPDDLPWSDEVSP